MELTDKDTVNIERAREVGVQRGYVLNSDTKRVRKIANLLVQNEEQFGKYYCPCKQSHPLDPAKDVLCPCPTLKDEVAKDGRCFCRLFFKSGAADEASPSACCGS